MTPEDGATYRDGNDFERNEFRSKQDIRPAQIQGGASILHFSVIGSVKYCGHVFQFFHGYI